MEMLTQCVKGKEQRQPACFTGAGCFDGLSAGRVMKSAFLVFIPLWKGQFSQHNAHFQVVFNLAWKCLLYPRPEPAELMGNTHLGSCALPSEEVTNGVRRVVKDSASQCPSAHRDLPHHTGIVSFQSYLWLLWVAIGSFLFLQVRYRVWRCQLIFGGP